LCAAEDPFVARRRRLAAWLSEQGQAAALLVDFEGLRSEDGRVSGTYIHGLFDTDAFRRDFLNMIRQSKGWQPLPQKIHFDPDKEFDKLAELLRRNIDMKSLYDLTGVRSDGC